MAEYMVVENDIVKGIFCGYEYTEEEYDKHGNVVKPVEKIIPQGAVDLPENHEVNVGDNINMFTEDFKRKADIDVFSYLNSDEQTQIIRNKRDNLINEADILLLKYQEQVELGVINADDDYRLSLLQYKENLRNVPEQAGFPMNVVWPEIPARK